MMPGSGMTAGAHLVLGLTSLWALLSVSHLPYAALGFALYFLHGILGTIAYGVAEISVEVYRMYRGVVMWSLGLGLPLFVSQVYVNAGFSQRLALVHFLLPLGYIFFWGRSASKRQANSVPTPALETIQCLYLSFLMYVSLMNGFHYGVSTAVSFGIAFCLIGTSGTVKNAPARDLFSYALSFSIYFLVRTLESE